MADFDALEFTEVETAPVLALQLAGECGSDPSSIAAAIGPAFQKAMALAARHKLAPAAPPRAIYKSFGAQGVSFVVVLPVAADPGALDDPAFTVGTIPAGRAYRFTHRGPYPNLRDTYVKIDEFLKSKGWVKSDRDWARFMPMWEEYVHDPGTTAEADLLTYIYLPAA